MENGRFVLKIQVMSELSNNLLPLIDYASTEGLAAEINVASRDWDQMSASEAYGTFYRAMVLSSVDAQVFEAVAHDFNTVDPAPRYAILAKTLNGLDDEMIISQRHKLLQLVGGLDRSDDQAIEQLGLRSQLDRAVVFDRLQRTGLVGGFIFDQDFFLDKIIDPENGFEVTLDELLGLGASYDPTKKSKDEVIATFNAWADDPEGGRKRLSADGMSFLQRDLAMGYEGGRPGKQGITESEAMAKLEHYVATNSHDLIVAYVEDLLFERSPVALRVFDSLSSRGMRGMLLEGSEQLPRAYGLALAAAGRTEEAQAIAMGPRTKYEDYAYINLEIARYQRRAGNPQAAIATLDSLREVDPLFHFADRADPDEYIGMMGGSPLGFMNESIAEEYALCAAFGKSLQAYKYSRQYPEQTEPQLAQTAVSLAKAEEYFQELLIFDADEHDTLFMISRLSVALLDRLNRNIALGNTFNDTYPEIAAQVPTLAQRLQTIREQRADDNLATRVIDKTLVEVLTATGNHEAALEMLGRQEISSISPMQAFGRVLTDMAYRGQYEKAIELYDDWADHYRWVLDVDISQFNIAGMGWSLVNGRRDDFDRFYGLLPDYKRSLALFSMLQTFEGQDLHLDDELVTLVMRSDFHRGTMEQGVAAVGRLMLGRAAVTASHVHILH